MKKVIAMTVIGTVLAGAAWAADAPAAFDKKCKPCHSVAGAGGPMAKLGGPLDDAGAKHDEAWLRAYIADPKSKVPDAKMPKAQLSTEELDAIVKYVAGLKKPAGSK